MVLVQLEVEQHVEEYKLIHSYLLVLSDLHIKPDTLKLIEKKPGESLEHMGKGEIFRNRTPMAYALRSRINKWDLRHYKVSVRQRTLSIRKNSNQKIG